MRTQPIIHRFTEVNIGKYRSVKHYDLQTVENGTTQLTNQINISANRECAKSMPLYWVKVREGKKWSSWITGLFKTNIKGILKGDINHKQHLVIFRFSNDMNELTVYYFQNYFTRDTDRIVERINTIES